MPYPRVAGPHIRPAGVVAAKSGFNPALSRNCEAPRGDEPGRPPCTERTSALGGRAVRAAPPPGLLPPQTRRFSLSDQTTQPRRSRRSRGIAAPLTAPVGTSVALSWSGGKDSALALWTLRRQALQPEALITTVTEGYDRISMHGVRRELLARQADALGTPLVEIAIPPGCVNEVYEARMAGAFAVPPLSDVEAVAFGDLFLEDVRAYREARLTAAGKRGLFPLWGRNTGELARASIPAARTASSTPSCTPARSSPRRSPARRARSSSATASSSATSSRHEPRRPHRRHPRQRRRARSCSRGHRATRRR